MSYISKILIKLLHRFDSKKKEQTRIFHYNKIKSNAKTTILCLDDDLIALRILERDLTELFDINLITASSSNDALVYLEMHTVDFIIQDIIRPELNGWDFLRFIRTQDRLKNIPVLFITNMSLDDKFKKDAEQLNASYAPKPCLKPKLKEKILELLPHIKFT